MSTIHQLATNPLLISGPVFQPFLLCGPQHGSSEHAEKKERETCLGPGHSRLFLLLPFGQVPEQADHASCTYLLSILGCRVCFLCPELLQMQQWPLCGSEPAVLLSQDPPWPSAHFDSFSYSLLTALFPWLLLPEVAPVVCSVVPSAW